MLNARDLVPRINPAWYRGWRHSLAIGLRPLSCLNAALDWVFVRLLLVLITAMVAVALAIVYFRYVANASLVWGEELDRYLMVWLTFVGIVVAYRRAEHIKIVFALEKTRGRVNATIRRISALFVLVMFVFLSVAGVQYVRKNLERDQRSPALRLPIAYVQLSIPVSAVALTGLALERLGIELLGGRSDDHTDNYGLGPSADDEVHERTVPRMIP